MPLVLTLRYMGQPFHTNTINDIMIWIINPFKIGIVDTYNLKIWIALSLRMTNFFHIGYPGKHCPLPLLNCIGFTIEFNDLHIPQRLGPSCLGRYCRCETYPHGIWVSWFTSNTPYWSWTYLFSLWWPLQTHHTYGRGLPVGIIWLSRSGKWRQFLIRTVRIICIIKFCS